MNKIPVLGTGMSGLVGSKFVEDFASTYQVTNLDVRDPENPVDITQYQQVLKAFQDSPSEVIIHMAAFTNVTAAWEQTGDKSGVAWQVNVVGTEHVVKAAQETGKYLIHISTAYVFDGEKEGLYTEEDQPRPIEWYGQTKLEAEKLVAHSQANSCIFRIDQPFRSDTFPKVDTAHRIIAGLQDGTLYPQFEDHFFGPTFIDDFSKVLDWAVRTRPTGLFNASSGESWSDFEFASALNSALDLGGVVSPGSLTEYLKQTERPYQKNTAMDASKLQAELDFKLTPIAEALGMLKY